MDLFIIEDRCSGGTAHFSSLLLETLAEIGVFGIVTNFKYKPQSGAPLPENGIMVDSVSDLYEYAFDCDTPFTYVLDNTFNEFGPTVSLDRLKHYSPEEHDTYWLSFEDLGDGVCCKIDVSYGDREIDAISYKGVKKSLVIENTDILDLVNDLPDHIKNLYWEKFPPEGHYCS